MAALGSFNRLLNFATNTCVKRILPALTNKQYYLGLKLRQIEVAGYASRRQPIKYKLPWFKPNPSYQEEIPEEYEEKKEKAAADIINKINKQIATNQVGRLFAVIHLCGTQFKITENDVITIQGHWPPQPGDQINLEKVLLIGGKDFTLIGRPILNRELVSVNATVIQKTLSHTITRFRMRPRKQFKRLNFIRIPRTMLRINSITINGNVDKKKEVEGLDRIY